ncbi:MAG: hypothetical protein K6F99_07845, partial [Lachnospiraceae bacterium]|nr:hypothetical protein [Lachnospiraceae bacterium]
MRIINLSRLMILSGIFFIIFMSVPVYAKSLNSITDGAGYDLECNEGNILSSGDVIFKLDTTLLNENEYYCRSFINDKGEESILLPVEDGIFTLEFGDAERIAFYIINEEDGSMKRITDGADGVFSVSFIDDTDMSIESELLYDRGVMIDGVRYITGAAPELRVAPVDALAVFVKVTRNGKTVKHRVKDEFEMEFSQGSYGICVYGVTGKGTIIDGEESRFIYDCSGPTTPYLKFESETGGEQDGDNILFNSPLRLIPQSKDEYAGVSHYEFVFSDGSVQKGGSLLLEDDMKEKVTVYAVDRIGNYSEGVSLSGEMIIDTGKPVLKDISLKETEKGVVIRSEVKDELSGMGKQKLILNGKEIREETFDFKDRNKNLEREFIITD